ncbi:hypothetical protein [Burkholderia lata]|uniref:hypothetical protein n=1 Tax=Burkholderia lata (strain ATCC 17760 / DSM 23089 / LMG 22485 / NCIMB 9086 / R18194 / 383) TaxID=482957 RepID=UPI00145438B8|nr:hypothetical protein [Burkholderia lata]VWM20558.1 hypothetical protein BLA6992_07456 [Burkholderia lata]
MANSTRARLSTGFATTVTEQLERLEAMFHAIRGELDRDCYAYQIADLGQEVASGYAATMKKIAEMEASHG